jgi:hypothetical protein
LLMEDRLRSEAGRPPAKLHPGEEIGFPSISIPRYFVCTRRLAHVGLGNPQQFHALGDG